MGKKSKSKNKKSKPIKLPDLEEEAPLKIDFTASEASHLNHDHGSGNDVNAYVNLKYFDSNHQCLSEWNPKDLKDLSAFIEKIAKMTWAQIYQSGGKRGNKAGLGYTRHKSYDVLPNQDLISRISEDITFFELRVSQKARVHGFRCKSSFFLIWLDAEHQVYKQ